MTQYNFIKQDLQTKSDLEWFDTLCDILKKDNSPTTFSLTQLIGEEAPNPANQERYSKLLIPFDKRFKWAWISPDLADTDVDKPLDSLSFGGTDFCLKMTDLTQRFSDFKTERNVYDGGTQIFFYPVAEEYEFSAIEFRTDTDVEDINDFLALEFHTVTFQFGNKIFLTRAGFYMTR